MLLGAISNCQDYLINYFYLDLILVFLSCKVVISVLLPQAY